MSGAFDRAAQGDVSSASYIWSKIHQNPALAELFSGRAGSWSLGKRGGVSAPGRQAIDELFGAALGTGRPFPSYSLSGTASATQATTMVKDIHSMAGDLHRLATGGVPWKATFIHPAAIPMGGARPGSAYTGSVPPAGRAYAPPPPGGWPIPMGPWGPIGGGAGGGAGGGGGRGGGGGFAAPPGGRGGGGGGGGGGGALGGASAYARGIMGARTAMAALAGGGLPSVPTALWAVAAVVPPLMVALEAYETAKLIYELPKFQAGIINSASPFGNIMAQSYRMGGAAGIGGKDILQSVYPFSGYSAAGQLGRWISPPVPKFLEAFGLKPEDAFNMVQQFGWRGLPGVNVRKPTIGPFGDIPPPKNDFEALVTQLGWIENSPAARALPPGMATAFTGRQVSRHQASALGTWEPFEGILEKAFDKGIDSSTVLKSMDATLESMEKQGANMLSPQGFATFWAQFQKFDLPGTRTGSMQADIMTSMTGRLGNVLGSVPTTLALAQYTAGFDLTKREGWAKMLGPDFEAILHKDPLTQHLFGDVTKGRLIMQSPLGLQALGEVLQSPGGLNVLVGAAKQMAANFGFGGDVGQDAMIKAVTGVKTLRQAALLREMSSGSIEGKRMQEFMNDPKSQIPDWFQLRALGGQLELQQPFFMYGVAHGVEELNDLMGKSEEFLKNIDQNISELLKQFGVTPRIAQTPASTEKHFTWGGPTMPPGYTPASYSPGNSTPWTGIPAGQPGPGKGTGGDPRGMIPVIRAAAAYYGLDPDDMVNLAKAEGLKGFLGDWRPGQGYTSGGAFQLNMLQGSLGEKYKAETGHDPRDPKYEQEAIWWATKYIKEHGVGRNWSSINAGYVRIPRVTGSTRSGATVETPNKSPFLPGSIPGTEHFVPGQHTHTFNPDHGPGYPDHPHIPTDVHPASYKTSGKGYWGEEWWQSHVMLQNGHVVVRQNTI